MSHTLFFLAFIIMVRSEVNLIYHSVAPPNPNYLIPVAYEEPPTLFLSPEETQDFPPKPPLEEDAIIIPAAPLSNQPRLSPELRLENMSCIQEQHFRATFRMSNDDFQAPVLEDTSGGGCISSLGVGRFVIDLEGSGAMLKCGVRRCKQGNFSEINHMCVVLRVPIVRGVRLPEDRVVTLMCVPQERVVTRVKHLKIGRNNILEANKGRAAQNGIVATGGTQKELKFRLGIFKKRFGSSNFDQNVQSDSIIELGEELLLRAVVDADGWKNSHIGPVILTGVNSKKSALLVNQEGCVNPTMKSICKPPEKVGPLNTELHFRAFLFQEAPQGDEMVLSVRILACLNTHDCFKVHQSCLATSEDSTHFSRSKRQLSSNENSSFTNWESRLSFKVRPGKVHRAQHNRNNGFLLFSILGTLLGMSLIVLMMCLLLKLSFSVN
ncbi:hypothetical protein ABEB36_012081 [Hypothenemus hampei]|uniref:ZP domain-containing protein n=1 Tax=Hypothenemus hampei TaxID=57062 RepID=A0ABD1EA67_HYPHA